MGVCTKKGSRAQKIHKEIIAHATKLTQNAIAYARCIWYNSIKIRVLGRKRIGDFPAKSIIFLMGVFMDYTIAFLIPSRVVAESVKRYLEKMGLQYPVFAASTRGAVEIMRELLPKGVRLIVSQGITAKYLMRDIPLPLMELPFSGIDAMIAVKHALETSGDRKIIHMGTRSLYHLIQRSVQYLGEDTERIAFCDLQMGSTIEEQAQAMIEQGYEIFIGGFASVDYARSAGKTGFEFDVDELIIQATVLNAQTLVRSMMEQERQYELDKAILQVSADGIIAVDHARKIYEANLAAMQIVHGSTETLLGRDLDEVLHENRLVDVEKLDIFPDDTDTKVTPVVLKEAPVMVHGEQKGSVISIKKVSEIQEMEYHIRKDLVVKGLVAKNSFDSISGVSAAICQAKERAAVYAKYDSTILIYGETGTGKELFAQSIHNASKRKKQPFVAINCATLPESLVESELFGYAKGAFTGANREGKQGLFEIADKGTIFLDEISEIPLSIQSKLLRVIQEGEIVRVGGDKVIRVDVRVICSSNKDLKKLIKEGKFKDDLYYRLSVLEIDIPPLRERSEDIECLSYSLLRELSVKHGKNVVGITPEVLDSLSKMRFMGNIRELSNMMERMVILTDGNTLNIDVLRQCNIQLDDEEPSPAAAAEISVESVGRNGLILKTLEQCHGSKEAAARRLGISVEDIQQTQKELLVEALDKCRGNKAAAARMLGINTSTLWRRMKALEML